MALGVRRAGFRNAWLATSLCWAALLPGCHGPADVEPCLELRLATPPEPEYPTRPRLGVYLSLLDGGLSGGPTVNRLGTMNITAYLEPGYERLGKRDDCPGGYALRPREVVNDTLRVAGVALIPLRTWRDGLREYAFDSTLAPAEFAAVVLSVAPPTVAGVAAFTTAPGWTGIARLDSDTVRIARGADLELHLHIPEHSPEATRGQLSWRLEVRGGAAAVSVASDGRPPARLVVPGNLDRTDSIGVGIAELYSTEIGSAGTGGGEYSMLAGMFVRLRWVIRIEQAPS